MLELTLSFDQASYAVGTPIAARVTLRNAGPEPALVNTRLALNRSSAPRDFRDVSLVITTASGDRLDFLPKVNIGTPKDSYFKSLAPGEAVERSYALQDYFRLDQPGSYTAQATYQNQVDPTSGQPAWKGEVTSNPVSFTIKG